MTHIISQDIDTIINAYRTYDELEDYYKCTDYNWKPLVSEYFAREEDTDDTLKQLPNLTTLDCGCNQNFTDEGLKHLPHLKILSCFYNINFTTTYLESRGLIQ